MDWECSTYGSDEKYVQTFGRETWKDNLGGLGMDGGDKVRMDP